MIQTDMWAPAVTTLQQEEDGICSMIQTVRLARATLEGPSTQEHELDPERVQTRIGRTAFGFSHGLACKASVVIALPECSGISRFFGSLMTPTGPTACSRQQWHSGRHMNLALPRIWAPTFMLCDIAAGALQDMQHDSDSAACVCERGGAQQHDLDPEHLRDTHRPQNIRLQP
jgi:hypothetical protein